MDELVNFLMEHYIYLVIVALFFILALIGYTIDTIKTNRLKREYENKDVNNALDIPVATLDGNLSGVGADNETKKETVETPVLLKSESPQKQ